MGQDADPPQGAPHMSQPHVDRMVREKADLDMKIGKLNFFLHTETFENQLPAHEQNLLREQMIVMNHYSSILAERIRLAG